MNNISTQQLQLGSGILTATGNTLYLNQSNISSSQTPQSGITGSINITQLFNLQPNVTGTSFTLSNLPFYINTGVSSVTWTLPLISTSTGRIYQIKNCGSSISLTGSSSDSIFAQYPVLSFTINSGEAYQLMNNGAYWCIG